MLGHIFSVIKQRVEAGQAVNPPALSGELSADEMSLLVAIMQKPEDLSGSAAAMGDYINKIHSERERANTGAPDFASIIRQKQDNKYDYGKKRKNEG